MASMISELESHHVLVNGYFSDEIDKINEKVPLIAHYKRGHFVVVLKIDEDFCHIIDPEFGVIENMATKDFLEEFSGYLIAE